MPHVRAGARAHEQAGVRAGPGRLPGGQICAYKLSWLTTFRSRRCA